MVTSAFCRRTPSSPPPLKPLPYGSDDMPPPDLHDYLLWLAQQLAKDGDEGLESIVRRALGGFRQPDFVVLAHDALDAVVRAGTAVLGPVQDNQLRDVLAHLRQRLEPVRRAPDGSLYKPN